AVAERMGLRRGGDAAEWAAELVHADVSAESPIGFTSHVPQDPLRMGAIWADEAWLRIRVDSFSAGLGLLRHGSQTAAHSFADDGLAFDDWEALRRAAHEMVDCAIDSMRNDLGRWYAAEHGSERN